MEDIHDSDYTCSNMKIAGILDNHAVQFYYLNQRTGNEFTKESTIEGKTLNQRFMPAFVAIDNDVVLKCTFFHSKHFLKVLLSARQRESAESVNNKIFFSSTLKLFFDSSAPQGSASSYFLEGQLFAGIESKRLVSFCKSEYLSPISSYDGFEILQRSIFNESIQSSIFSTSGKIKEETGLALDAAYFVLEVDDDFLEFPELFEGIPCQISFVQASSGASVKS